MLNFKFKSKLVFFDDVSVIKTMQQADFMDIFWQAKHNQIFQRFDSAVSAEWQRFFHLVSWKVQSSAKTGIILYNYLYLLLMIYIFKILFVPTSNNVTTSNHLSSKWYDLYYTVYIDNIIAILRRTTFRCCR